MMEELFLESTLRVIGDSQAGGSVGMGHQGLRMKREALGTGLSYLPQQGPESTVA
jgi:hypothetical protein